MVDTLVISGPMQKTQHFPVRYKHILCDSPY